MVLFKFMHHIQMLGSGDVVWNGHEFVADEFDAVLRAFIHHDVFHAVGAWMEVTAIARVETAIQSSATMIAILRRMFQQHGAHVQHAQSVGDRVLVAPEITNLLWMGQSCFQTCEKEINGMLILKCYENCECRTIMVDGTYRFYRRNNTYSNCPATLDIVP